MHVISKYQVCTPLCLGCQNLQIIKSQLQQENYIIQGWSTHLRPRISPHNGHEHIWWPLLRWTEHVTWFRRHVQGVCEKVAEAFEMSHGVRVDAATQITICCGQSEAMAATVFAGNSCHSRVPTSVTSTSVDFCYYIQDSLKVCSDFVLWVWQ